MTPLIVALGAGAAGLGAWYAYRRRETVPCVVDLERTHEHMHAHVILKEDRRIAPGDSVLVRGAPDHIEYGARETLEADAVLEHATLPRRAWTRLIGFLEFDELLEVGFE